jgi:hypothetical protein
MAFPKIHADALSPNIAANQEFSANSGGVDGVTFNGALDIATKPIPKEVAAGVLPNSGSTPTLYFAIDAGKMEDLRLQVYRAREAGQEQGNSPGDLSDRSSVIQIRTLDKYGPLLLSLTAKIQLSGSVDSFEVSFDMPPSCSCLIHGMPVSKISNT